MRHLLFALAAGLVAGCWSGGDQPEVVVYTALDSEFSQPIFDDFTRQTGIRVLAKFDTESTKTVGLTQALIAESGRPRCDVFWNNEILNTLRLEARGLLDGWHPAAAAGWPAMYRSPQGTWYGFAARARVLVVNTRLVAADEMPDSIYDLLDPKYKGRIGIAKPLFGTTATHAACLFAVLGEDRARDFFDALKGNDVQILSGNKQVALAAAAGQIVLGLTDTDDAIIEVERGMPVEIVYPDRGADQLGTLFIPNTLAVIKDCPHPEAARRLVDYLLAPAVEERLAAGPSAQIPLGPNAAARPRVETPATVKAMPVDFARAAALWQTTADFLREHFTGP